MNNTVAETTKVFRPPTWMTLLSVCCLLLFSAVAFLLYKLDGWTWTTIASVLLVIISIAGLFDTLTSRVILSEDSIIIINNMLRHEYPRDMFVKVTWAKGVPVSLKSKEGKWIRLPEVGKGGQALTNTLRAWIR